MSRKVKVKKITRAGAPNPDSGKYVVIAVVCILILLLGFGAGRFTASSSGSQSISIQKTTPIGEAYSQYGPKDIVGIAPVGFDKSPQGAATAASAYVGLTSRLYFATNELYNSSVAQIAHPDYVEDFKQAFTFAKNDAIQIMEQDSAAFLREIPLGFTFESVREENIKVAVWSIVMIAARPEFDGRTESKVHMVDLTWKDGDWKVNGWETLPGPTPKWLAPSETILSVDQFLNITSLFDGGYDYVPSF